MVRHFRDVEGLRFESLEPFNEPDLSWTAGGRQEGYSASYDLQNALIPILAARLKRNGLDTFVSGVDMNNVADAISGLGQLDPRALSALGRLNTHDYHLLNNPAQLQHYRALAQKLRKPIWMSEIGCCFAQQGDGTEIWGALFIAELGANGLTRLRLRSLGALATRLECDRVRHEGGATPTTKAVLCYCSIHSIHSAWLSDHFGRRSLQYACCLFAGNKAPCACQHELGEGDSERCRPQRIR